MTVLARLRSLFAFSLGTGPDPSGYDSAMAWQKGLPMGVPGQLDRPYAQHPTISKGIASIAEDAASVEWEVYPKGASEEDDALETDPLLDLWERPNIYMSGTDLWVATYTCFKLWGETVWYYPGLSMGRRGGLRATEGTRAGELILLDPTVLRVKPGTSGPAYSYPLVTSEYVALDPRAVTHFKRFNPYNPLRGLSEVEALRIEVEADHNASRFNREQFGERSGIPAGMIRPPKDITVDKAEREDFLRRMNERHRGNRAIGWLPPEHDWIAMGMNARDMDFKALREYAREQGFAVLGVPPFLAGILDKANYANAREQKSVYWAGTITRLLGYFQAKLNTDFLEKVGRTDVEVYPRWETVKALTENLQDKVTVAQGLFGMGFTKRQINERLELGINVDDLEDADVGYLPFTISPVGALGEARSAAGPAAQPPAEGNQNGQNGQVRSFGGDAKEARRALVWRATISGTRDLEFRFSKTVRAHFNALERESLDSLAGMKGWFATVQKQGAGFFDYQKATQALKKQTEPLYRASIVRGAEAIIAELDLGVDFNVTNPRVLAKLAQLTGKITRIDETIERDLRETLNEGLGLGESPQQLAKRIEAVFDAGRARAITIARTETGTAFAWGRYAEMNDAGIKRHEWLSARDEKVRADHVAEDGNVVMIGDPFPVTHLTYPLDSSGPPEEIINCRCVALPVVEGAQ